MIKSLFEQASLAYDNGNYKEAFTLFYELAQCGDIDSMTRIASMYSAGEGIAIDFEKSIAWDEKAVSGGSIASLSNLGITNRMRGDIIRAKFWFEKAISAGDNEAALDLAKMYLISELETERVKQYLELVLGGENISDIAREEARNIIKSIK